MKNVGENIDDENNLYPIKVMKSAVEPSWSSARFIINALYRNPLYLSDLSIPDNSVT